MMGMVEEVAQDTGAVADMVDEEAMTTTVAVEITMVVGEEGMAATKSVAHSVCVDNGKLFEDIDSCLEIFIK